MRVVISAPFQAAKKLPMPNLGTFTLGDESRLKLSNWSLGGDVKILGIPYVVHIPSGNLLHSYGKSPFIVDFPIEHEDFPQLCNSYVANYQRVESLWSQGMISMIYEFIWYLIKVHERIRNSINIHQWISNVNEPFGQAMILWWPWLPAPCGTLTAFGP